MIISESNLKHIIAESIKDVLMEMKGFIDERLFELAKHIYNIILAGRNDFVLSQEEVSKYYPYSHSKELHVCAGVSVTKGFMEYKNGTILINLDAVINNNAEDSISKIAHELTHVVNDNEGGIPDIMVKAMPELKRFNYMLYLMRNTECNARCSQFACYLSQVKVQSIKAYEDITRLNEIEELIYENDRFDFYLKEKYHTSILNIKKKFERYKSKIFKIYHHFYSLKKK